MNFKEGQIVFHTEVEACFEFHYKRHIYANLEKLKPATKEQIKYFEENKTDNRNPIVHLPIADPFKKDFLNICSRIIRDVNPLYEGDKQKLVRETIYAHTDRAIDIFNSEVSPMNYIIEDKLKIVFLPESEEWFVEIEYSYKSQKFKNSVQLSVTTAEEAYDRLIDAFFSAATMKVTRECRENGSAQFCLFLEDWKTKLEKK